MIFLASTEDSVFLVFFFLLPSVLLLDPLHARLSLYGLLEIPFDVFTSEARKFRSHIKRSSLLRIQSESFIAMPRPGKFRSVFFFSFVYLQQKQIHAMRNISIKATAANTIINVPKGVARSMALSQNSVPLVELVGVVVGADVAMLEDVTTVVAGETGVGDVKLVEFGKVVDVSTVANKKCKMNTETKRIYG